MTISGTYLFFLFFFSGFGKDIIDEKDSVKNISYQFLDINSETEFPILCENFESQFEGHIISKNIVNPSTITAILKAINKQSTPDENGSVDIRRKLLMNHSSGKTDTICLTENGGFFVMKGQTFRINDKEAIKLLSTEE